MQSVRWVWMSFGLAALLGAGCTTYKDQTRAMTGAWRGGQPAVAARAFAARVVHTGKTDAVVWNLEAGAAYRTADDFTNSNRHLDAAAVVINDYEQQAKVKLASETAAMLSNQQNLPYKGKPYDKIMLHTYKALNYLNLGEVDKARPEIIRAYQCQQDAVDENARRIEKAQQAEAESKDKDKIEKSRNDPQFSAALGGITKDLDGFKFYADYVNPFTVYLDGLYFLHAGAGGSDLERAGKSLNRVIEVCGGNKCVQADLETVTNAMAGQAPEPCTYVIFETGQAASLDQVRIDVPIILAKVSYVGAAFPRLVFHDDHARELRIKAGEREETTQPLASMDSMVALDFKNEFPTIVTKTLISTVTKAAAAYVANDAAGQQSQIAGLFTQAFTAVAQSAVNVADTRCWTTLPKEFQVARFPTPAGHRLTLSAGSSPPVEVNLIDGRVNVVYVRSVTATTPLQVSQFKFGEASPASTAGGPGPVSQVKTNESN